MERRVSLELSNDEALVLFEWLNRESMGEQLPMEHPAERYALLSLEARLDKILVEPFLPEYRDLLCAARDRVLQAKEAAGNADAG